VDREIITMMVDYTQILKKKDCERKKENVFLGCPERRNFFFREK
jgi:hypothetical protein